MQRQPAGVARQGGHGVLIRGRHCAACEGWWVQRQPAEAKPHFHVTLAGSCVLPDPYSLSAAPCACAPACAPLPTRLFCPVCSSAGHRGAAHHSRRPAALWRGECRALVGLAALVLCCPSILDVAWPTQQTQIRPAGWACPVLACLLLFSTLKTLMRIRRSPSRWARRTPLSALNPAHRRTHPLPAPLAYPQMDEKIPEPLGAAHTDPMGAFPAIRKAIMDNFRR